jgi:hypothetical protein
MAFDNVSFPTIKLIHGVQKDVINPIGIVSNGNSEFRIQKASQERYRWVYPARLMLQEDKVELYKFWKQRDRGLNSFKYQDPEYPNFVDAPLEHMTGLQWRHAIPLDSTTPGDHPVHNFADDLVVKVDGTVTGFTTGHDANGVPYLSVTGTTGTETVTISGKCELSARFDGDISVSLAALNADNTPSLVNTNDISLIEVFEY